MAYVELALPALLPCSLGLGASKRPASAAGAARELARSELLLLLRPLAEPSWLPEVMKRCAQRLVLRPLPCDTRADAGPSSPAADMARLRFKGCLAWGSASSPAPPEMFLLASPVLLRARLPDTMAGAALSPPLLCAAASLP